MRTSSNATTPAQYIASLEESWRSQIRELDRLIRKTVPALKPLLLAGMLAYGPYRYKYASGREGDWALLTLASQKHYISLYICALDGKRYVAEKYKPDLPKASIGKSCIRFKRLEDVDAAVLQRIFKEAERLGGAGAVA